MGLFHLDFSEWRLYEITSTVRSAGFALRWFAWLIFWTISLIHVFNIATYSCFQSSKFLRGFSDRFLSGSDYIMAVNTNNLVQSAPDRLARPALIVLLYL